MLELTGSAYTQMYTYIGIYILYILYIYTQVLQHFMEHPFFPCKNHGFPLFHGHENPKIPWLSASFRHGEPPRPAAQRRREPGPGAVQSGRAARHAATPATKHKPAIRRGTRMAFKMGKHRKFDVYY